MLVSPSVTSFISTSSSLESLLSMFAGSMFAGRMFALLPDGSGGRLKEEQAVAGSLLFAERFVKDPGLQVGMFY